MGGWALNSGGGKKKAEETSEHKTIHVLDVHNEKTAELYMD